VAQAEIRRRAADSFTVEVLTFGALVRYVAFFVIKLKTRAAEIAGISCQPDELWMTQRNPIGAGDGFLRGVQYVILTAIRSTPPRFGAYRGTAA